MATPTSSPRGTGPSYLWPEGILPTDGDLGLHLSSTPCCFSAGAQLLHPRRQYVIEGEGDSTVLRRALYSYYLLRCLVLWYVVKTPDGKVGYYLHTSKLLARHGVGSMYSINLLTTSAKQLMVLCSYVDYQH